MNRSTRDQVVGIATVGALATAVASVVASLVLAGPAAASLGADADGVAAAGRDNTGSRSSPR